MKENELQKQQQQQQQRQQQQQQQFKLASLTCIDSVRLTIKQFTMIQKRNS